MKRNLIVAAIFALTVMGVGLNSARAELREGAFTLSPMGGIYLFDEDQNIEKGPVAGLGFDYQWAERWSVELMLTHGWHDLHYLSCFCQTDDVKAMAGKLDLLYYPWPEARFAPYLAVGAGFMKLDFDSFNTQDDGFADYGGGVKYFLSEDIALRADVRGIRTFDDSYNNMSAMIGLSFLFGGGKKVEAPVEEQVVRPVPTTRTEAVVVEKEAPKPVKPEPFDILFEFDKINLNSTVHENLKKVADFLRANEQFIVRIEGHADDRGSLKYNRGLSMRRAYSVGNYLANELGIPRTRMQFVGFGEIRPMDTNATAEGRSHNRRVELKYIEVIR